jgi:SP family general alpha glucoside:H+ symporter-like MFS transporter
MTTHIETQQMGEISASTSDTEHATAVQKSMTLKEAISLYRKAVCFSCLMSFAVVMEGYDTALIGNFYGLDTFNRKFGQQVEGSRSYQLSSNWQSALQSGATAGQVVGLLLGGYLADRFGYIKTMLGNLLALIGFIFLFFFAQNVEMLLAAEILCGVPWGAFQTL